MSAAKVTIFPDSEALARAAAEFIVERAIASKERFALNLSGGSTPKRLYEMLAAEPLRGRMPWNRVHLFFGDERFVPRDDPESNYRMVANAMIAHVPIPPENVHGIPADGTVDDAASAYERTLREYNGRNTLDPAHPLFEVTLLGLGEDGHTASLFPGTDVLTERIAWAKAVVGAKPEPRITLTYPVLDSSRVALFLVAGAGKQAILQRLLAGDAALPSAHVSPAGELRVFADAAAAGTACAK